jgi:hypothetical protein
MERDIIKCQRRRSRPSKSVMVAVAVLAVVAVLPVGAAADQTTCREAVEASEKTSSPAEWGGSCAGLTCREWIEVADETKTSFEWEGLDESLCGPPPAVETARKEIGAADEARLHAEEEEARAKALSEPIRNLSVKVVAHSAGCRQACQGAFRHPGYTTLRIAAAPFAYVTIQLVRYGHRTEHLELQREEPEWAMRVPWTCGRPGGVYRYTVSARSDVGTTLVQRGTFGPVSAARCHWLRHAVQAERENNERQFREGQRQLEREERERLKQWEGNCRALGDTPVVLHDEGSTIHACRTPEGYTVEVPE